eukprot:6196446-Pyramimonas_sp.AAC.1
MTLEKSPWRTLCSFGSGDLDYLGNTEDAAPLKVGRLPTASANTPESAAESEEWASLVREWAAKAAGEHAPEELRAALHTLGVALA